MAHRRNTTDLLDAYLGQRTGAQILGGLTHRGDGEDIEAAILFCDLRDSTALAEELSREAYLELLNGFFELAVEPVLANGGEVLKFIGDAILAIFPVETESSGSSDVAAACRRDARRQRRSSNGLRRLITLETGRSGAASACTSEM